MIRLQRVIRAIVWLIDLRWGSFEETQGGVGSGAVVVEAGVETFEGFGVVEAQDASPQQGEDWASAGFFARAKSCTARDREPGCCRWRPAIRLSSANG